MRTASNANAWQTGGKLRGAGVPGARADAGRASIGLKFERLSCKVHAMEMLLSTLRHATPLPQSFYDRPTVEVARDLLGAFVVRQSGDVLRIGRIVETEAYLGVRDKACHSSRGRTPRTRTMFGPPGHAYVYQIYGMHFCLNAVTEPPEQPCAVLIRALEPIAGVESRCDGPGRLCRAMGIDRDFNGQDLTSSALWIAPRWPQPAPRFVRRPRIGVEYAGGWARRLLRFVVRDCPFVSAP